MSYQSSPQNTPKAAYVPYRWEDHYDLNAIRHAIRGISDRRVAVLSMIACGKTNLEISQGLGIGVKTIEAEVTGILGALGLNSRVQAAVAWALVVSRDPEVITTS